MNEKEETRKSRVNADDYKYGYRRLYGFLRMKHPEILKEYREQCIMDKKRVDSILKQALEE